MSLLNRKFSRKMPYGTYEVQLLSIYEEVVNNRPRVVVEMDVPGYGVKRAYFFTDNQVEMQLAGILAQLDIDAIESVDQIPFPSKVNVQFTAYQGEGYDTALDSWNFDTTVIKREQEVTTESVVEESDEAF